MQIVVRQFSGLGNQLFQYAAGLHYSRQYGASLRGATDLPERALSHGLYPRPFLLSRFRIEIPMAPLSSEERLLFSVRAQLQPAIAAWKRLRGIQIYNEARERFWTFLSELPVAESTRTLYLVGYWQAFQVVESVAEQLRADLQLRQPPSAATEVVLARIRSCANPVSLHVRRGDYTLAVEGNRTLPLRFYEEAVRHFRTRRPDPTFFVFSDDIAWCRENLPLGERGVYVDHNNDATSHEDLILMAACRHHIIANSSFSWWGAWLNPREDKIVYAPRFWALTPDSYQPGLLPPQWIAAAF